MSTSEVKDELGNVIGTIEKWYREWRATTNVGGFESFRTKRDATEFVVRNNKEHQWRNSQRCNLANIKACLEYALEGSPGCFVYPLQTAIEKIGVTLCAMEKQAALYGK